MADQYHHTPLQHPRHIRILHLAPADDSAAPIHFRLDTISLNDHPGWDGDYTALSYSWDSQMPSCEVGCDGYSLLVTANCDAALRELRDTSRTIKMWIDSICIDQGRHAVEERNAQVALMGEIYKCAERVVVWLGRSDVRIRFALDLVAEIASFAKGSSVEGRRGCQEKAQEVSNMVRREAEDPFAALFRRSWFHRMWTVQEVTLSWRDRIIIRCGDIQIPWPDLITVVDALHAVKYRWGRWKEAMSLQRQLTTHLASRRDAGAIALPDDNSRDLRHGLSALSIFMSARRKKSTDPKDKVFALCGLFKELEIPLPAPDYSRPLEDVYREATVSCINYDHNLQILFHVPSDRRHDGLPSWVPDLAEDGWDTEDARYGLLARFAASGQCSATWSFSGGGTGLVLVGKVVDTIIFRADSMPDLDGISKELAYNAARRDLGHGEPDPEAETAYIHLNYRGYSVLKSWVDMSRWSDYPTGESTRKALQRTIVHDEPRANADATEESSFEHWYNTMILDELDITALALRHSGAAGSIPSAPREREIFLRQTMQRLPQEKLIFAALRGPGFRFHSRALTFAQKKCLFFTENNYIGTTPDPLPVSIEPGDKIAIVRGLQMPLALRPVEGGYRLLAQVYVHGIMYGEAWPQDEDTLEDIVLL